MLRKNIVLSHFFNRPNNHGSRIFSIALLLVMASVLFRPTLLAAANNDNDTRAGSIKGAQAFDIPGWFKQSFLQISEDASEAGEAEKHIILFFHLDACPYCNQLLSDNFVDVAADSFIRTNFDAIDINIKGDRDVEFNDTLSLTEKELAEHLQVKFTPTILFVDGDNKTVLRTDGYRGTERFQQALRYVTERAYESQTLNEYIASNASGNDANHGYSLRENAAFTDMDNLQAAAENPLMVIFEDESCTDCESFHDDLLSRDDVKETLSKIKIVRLNTDSNDVIRAVDGNETTAGQWAASLSVDYRPAVVFFDKNQEIVRMENRLWSWYFNGIISWVAGRHYTTHPDMYDYIRELREQRLAEGKDVNFRDDN